jgi:hypothetical protein
VILGTRCLADPLRKFGRFLVVPFAVRPELDLAKTAVVSRAEAGLSLTTESKT